jgi:asparagine synthase (glutamine-hydrolysing)
MLSGDGGDEFLGGYREVFRYFGWNRVRHIPGMNPAAAVLRGPWSGKRGAGVLDFLSKDNAGLLSALLQTKPVLALFREDAMGDAKLGLQELSERLAEHGRLPFPESIMEHTSTGYLPEQILVKVDRASMASALESRAPFLDRSLVEFLLALPTRYHFGQGHGKILLRKALPAGVPDEIRWRGKQGFTPPLAAWMRSSLRIKMQEAVETCRNQLGQILKFDSVQLKLEQHDAGADHSSDLFRWFALSRTLQGTTL